MSRQLKSLELRRGNDENSETLPRILYDGHTPANFFESSKWKHVLSVPPWSHVVIWSTRALESFFGNTAIKQFTELKDLSSFKVELMCEALNEMSQSVELAATIGPSAGQNRRGQKRVRDGEALFSESRRRVGTSHEPLRHEERETSLRMEGHEFTTIERAQSLLVNIFTGSTIYIDHARCSDTLVRNVKRLIIAYNGDVATKLSPAVTHIHCKRRRITGRTDVRR